MRFAKVRDVKTPTRGTAGSAGIDFYVPNFKKPFIVPAGQDILIPSGIKADIPKGYMLMAADKSGVVTTRYAQIGANLQPKSTASEEPLIIGAKIVDEDYQGEIHIHLINVGRSTLIIKPGTKIAQFILVPAFYDSLEEVPENELFSEKSERSAGAFGSTGNF